MTLQQFFKKYKWVVNQSRVERLAGVPINTIAHATSSEKRRMTKEQQGKVTRILKRLHKDLGEYIEPMIPFED